MDELFLARMNLHGTTKRERLINRQKQFLNRKFPETLSCKNVTIDSTPRQLVVDSGNHPYEKKICSLPGEKFETGDYVEWQNAHWLITEADIDDELYVDGIMEQCNWELVWQRQDGTIARYWCIDLNSTQYNSGESGNKYMTLGSAQHQLTIPYTPDTVILNTPQRFYLDKNMEKPTCYKVTQNDTTAYNYGNGLIKITLTQEECNKENDKLITLDDGSKAWIADYFSPTETPILPTHDYELRLIYTGSNLYTGEDAKHITAQLVNKSDNSVMETSYTWEINSDISKFLITSISENTVSIKVVDNPAAVHSTVKLKVSTSEGYEKVLDLYVKM